MIGFVTEALEILGLSLITGLDYWNGLLEWTIGLTFFALKITFMADNEIPLTEKLHFALDQTVKVSSHCTEPHIFKVS